MIEIILLASPFVAGYIYIRIIRPRIIHSNIPLQNITPQTPYHFVIQAEQETLEHEIAQDHTLLEKVETNDQTGIDVFHATSEDMIEHQERLEYNRGKIIAQRRKRFGYTNKRR